MINVCQPGLGGEELAAIGEVFAEGWLGHGPRTRKFEAEFAAHLGVPAEHPVFINSAPSGLFLAVALLDLGPADDVVLPIHQSLDDADVRRVADELRRAVEHRGRGEVAA